MEQRDYWLPEIPWVSSKDMKTDRISGSQMWVSDSAVRDGKTSLAKAGSVLMVVRSGILRHTIPIAIVARDIAYNQDIKALTVAPDSIVVDYFAHLIRGNQAAFLTLWSKQGATVESLEVPWIMETKIPLPPLEEQRAIAAFLDAMGERVTRFIAARRRMIALLEEQKQGITNQAVTRGLDPDVPMKASGIDWLGDIPAHWEVRRGTGLFTERKTTGMPDLPILEVSLVSGVAVRDFENSNRKQMMSDRAAYKVAMRGDVPYNMMRMWQGAVGVAPVDGLVSPAYVVLAPRAVLMMVARRGRGGGSHSGRSSPGCRRG